MNNHYGDYGISHTRRFLDWGLAKYGSEAALHQAWGEDRFDGNTLLLPSPDQRYHRKDSLSSFYRADALGRLSSDMDEFLSASCADAIEYFGRIVRRKAPEKLVGAFYGYFVHTDNPNYAGHLALEQLLNSDCVDFFAAPKSYYRCGPGQPGGELTAVQSVNLKKLWLDETDSRTHLAFADLPENKISTAKGKQRFDAAIDSLDWLCRDFNDSRCVLWREFCKNLSHGSGFWWMDLGGGWYDDPALMTEVSKMTALNEKLQSAPYDSLADILVLADEGVIGKMSISKTQREGFLEDPLMELSLSGGIADLYRLADLPVLDLSRYKMVIFAYTFDVSSETRAYLRSHLPADALLVFHHAAGIRKDGTCSLENIRDFTGFAMEEQAMDGDYVGVRVCDRQAQPLFGKKATGWPSPRPTKRRRCTAPWQSLPDVGCGLTAA